MPSIKYAYINRLPGYRFGDDGSVWTKLRSGTSVCKGMFRDEWRAKKVKIDKRSGYPMVWLRTGYNCGYPFLVHRLVLEAFVGPCPIGMQACHNNGIRDDVSLKNLRWDTIKNNAMDRVRHGTSLNCPLGENHGRAKLSLDAVQTAFYLWSSGMTHTAIAKKLRVNQSTVSRILCGKRWKRRLEQEGV